MYKLKTNLSILIILIMYLDLISLKYNIFYINLKCYNIH